MLHVIVGSKTDLPAVANSKLEAILKELGIPFRVHVISAHRNPVELHAFCATAQLGKQNLFMAVAGWAAALAGAIAAETDGSCPVIGVPLPGGPFANDSLYAMASMPPGRPVMVVPNLDNATLAAAQILAVGDPSLGTRLREYIARTTPESNMNVDLEQHRSKEKK